MMGNQRRKNEGEGKLYGRMKAKENSMEEILKIQKVIS